jgi:pilus assembly protein CpaB
LFSWKKKKESSSSSADWKSKAKELLPLLAGLILTLSAVFLARHRIASAEKDIARKAAPVEIVVPAVAIPAGGVFTEENLAKKPVPSSGIGSRNVPAGEYKLLVGARAKAELAPGEPILWTDVEEPYDVDVFSRTIPTGRRALTLEVDASASFAGLIRCGDRVDLSCEGENGRRTRSWILDVPVISVNRIYNRLPSGEETREVSTVTLSVTPEEGVLLASMARTGRIRWFLRNPEEPHRVVPPRAFAAGTLSENVEIWKRGLREVHPSKYEAAIP